MFRSRNPLLLAMMFTALSSGIVCLAQASQGQKPDSSNAVGKYDGRWTGKTSADKEITVELENNEVRLVVLPLSVGCPGHVSFLKRVFTSKSKVTVAGSSFSFTGEAETDCGNYRGIFAGKFDSSGLSGTAKLAAPGDSAAKTAESTFKATK